MVVYEIMSNSPYFIDARRSVRQAMRELMDADVRHLPVVDDGNLVGILSDRDVRGITAGVLEGADMEQRLDQPVSEVMSSDILTVARETDVREVIDAMIEHKVGAVPVVDDGALVGIVSYVDVLKAARDQL